MASSSAEPPPETTCPQLLALAGGCRILLDLDVAAEVHATGPMIAVPGAPPWIAGIASRRGRAMTIVDAGVLFGKWPAAGRSVVVLKGFAVKTALLMDDLPRLVDLSETADVLLDRRTLSEHPAFRPGAAAPGQGGHANGVRA